MVGIPCEYIWSVKYSHGHGWSKQRREFLIRDVGLDCAQSVLALSASNIILLVAVSRVVRMVAMPLAVQVRLVSVGLLVDLYICLFSVINPYLSAIACVSWLRIITFAHRQFQSYSSDEYFCTSYFLIYWFLQLFILVLSCTSPMIIALRVLLALVPPIPSKEVRPYFGDRVVGAVGCSGDISSYVVSCASSCPQGGKCVPLCIAGQTSFCWGTSSHFAYLLAFDFGWRWRGTQTGSFWRFTRFQGLICYWLVSKRLLWISGLCEAFKLVVDAFISDCDVSDTWSDDTMFGIHSSSRVKVSAEVDRVH